MGQSNWLIAAQKKKKEEKEVGLLKHPPTN
jgi:hypothetical protein